MGLLLSLLLLPPSLLWPWLSARTATAKVLLLLLQSATVTRGVRGADLLANRARARDLLLSLPSSLALLQLLLLLVLLLLLLLSLLLVVLLLLLLLLRKRPMRSR